MPRLNVLCFYKRPKTPSKISGFELDLCFDIIYQHAKYEWNQCSLSKIIERTPIFVLHVCFYKRPITLSKISGL